MYLYPFTGFLLVLTSGSSGSCFLLLFSHPVMSYSLQSHGLQHSSLPCPSLSPRVCSNSCPLSQWYHPTISSSAPSFSLCLQSFPASRSFPISQLFTSASKNIGTSSSASVLPMNIQGWFPLELTGLISLLSRGLSRVFSSITIWKLQFFALSLIYGPALTSIMTTGKNHSFDYTDLCRQSNDSAF